MDTDRQTTIDGLYAAGDVAGGCPQKYVTGALAEGKIAALAILKTFSEHFKAADDEKNNLNDSEASSDELEQRISTQADQVVAGYERALGTDKSGYSVEDIEEAMQKVMDEYAGGIATN